MPALVGMLPGVAATALAAALLTALWIALLNRLQAAADEPKQRGLHAVRTPRAAGLPLLLAWLLGVLFAFGSGAGALHGPMAWLLAITGLFLLMGLVDDFRPLPAAPKLLLQLAFAALALQHAWPGVPDFAPGQMLLAGLALVTFVNFWNFMDGSNGMVGWQSLLVALAIALWPGQAAWLAAAALALAAACAGFLPFNFPRARIFLGDAGSLGLGAALFLMLLLSWRNGVMAWWQALLLCTPMLLDTTLTLARRILGGRKFWQGHREHLFQYAVRVGHSHATVALAYAAATALAWLGALALAGNQSPRAGVWLLALAWGGGTLAYVALRRRWLGRSMRRGGRR
jgi:UDP-N-acetylmuramyl pentapeptide phosphotransferase/UDP-N-acetylglucosamine-1-phosphate transferase